ncbi:chalcone isomerase family protein [Glaciimonas soli]|nr:chalcone isomerase family protein [Glaciimonas soli]
MKSVLSSMLAALFFVVPVHAASWQSELPQAKVVGSGDFHWFGLNIYSARLWSEQQPFKASAPFALELTYHRKINRQRLVKTSMDEIKRLSDKSLSAEKLQRWESELARGFTDVASGDQLIGVFIPAQGCRFYNQKGLIAEIDDPELAQAFFNIWLDKRSKDNQLRAQLLGLTTGHSQ